MGGAGGNGLELCLAGVRQRGLPGGVGAPGEEPAGLRQGNCVGVARRQLHDGVVPVSGGEGGLPCRVGAEGKQVGGFGGGGRRWRRQVGGSRGAGA